VASAFISYSHEDQEFVLVLVEHLQRQGLEISYDRVALHIGDSLIRAISREIADGDFLIAVVSPASVESEWCQKELSLAMTQGIAERRVKVVPVRWREAAMPPMLSDALWADADRDDIETVACRLAAAMEAHLARREEQAVRAAEQVVDAQGVPAHEEKLGDVDVAQLEEVAQRAWDVFDAWNGVWHRRGNIHDLDDPQRRLRWALDGLPERVRAGLSLTERMASADWGEFFDGREAADTERDVSEELRSVRTQVARGLPVTQRWTIAGNLGQVSAGNRDSVSYLWEIRRGDQTERVQIFISRTAMASSNEHLPQEVAQAKETEGRSIVVTFLGVDDPPRRVSVTTAGVSTTMP
jgi:hypothetical protein